MTTVENPKDAIGSKKVTLAVLPWRVLWNVALAMLEGALKYGRHNYRAAGVRASVYFDAAQRHIGDWWEGVDIDPDSNLHHLDKAIAALMVARDSMLEGNFIDDRPPRGNVDMKELNAKAAALIERYGNIKPTHYTITSRPEGVNYIEMTINPRPDEQQIVFGPMVQKDAHPARH